MATGVRPWYRWHVNRWRNSPRVLAMSLAEQGAYRNLLDSGWENRGQIPNQTQILWRYAMASSPAEWDAVSAVVISMFDVSDDGKWLTNNTLSLEWKDASEWFDKKSKSGKMGAESRWHSAANGDAIPEVCERDSDAITMPMAKHSTSPHHTLPNHTEKTPARKLRRAQGKPNPTQVAKASGQTRHSRSQQIIVEWYKEWADVDCPWDGSEAANLSKILKAWPSVTDEQFVRCLENIALSECIPRGDRPREWLGKMPKFLDCALDQFWKPKNIRSSPRPPVTNAAADLELERQGIKVAK